MNTTAIISYVTDTGNSFFTPVTVSFLGGVLFGIVIYFVIMYFMNRSNSDSDSSFEEMKGGYTQMPKIKKATEDDIEEEMEDEDFIDDLGDDPKPAPVGKKAAVADESQILKNKIEQLEENQTKHQKGILLTQKYLKKMWASHKRLEDNFRLYIDRK